MSQFIEMFGDPLKNPKNYTQRKLGDVATLLNGRAYKASELLSSGRYLVLRVGNFFTNTDYYYSDLELEPDKYCDTGDILYSWSATLGAQIWKGGKVIYHYHIWKVLFDENILNKEYFCFMLNVMTDSLKQETHGSTMVHLTKDGMEKKFIAIPPLELQGRFVSIAEQADKSGFDELKSQFIEMFGDPVSWQTDTSLPTLNDTVNVISGFPFDSEKFDTEGVGIPLIRIRDIQRGYSETFTTEVFDKQYRIKKYELLVGMDGMFDIARWQSDEAALNQRVCCLRMKGSENDTFIQYLVQPILKHIENGTNATTVKHISTKQINGIRVPIASHEQKNKFAMIANQADKSGSVLQYRIAC